MNKGCFDGRSVAQGADVSAEYVDGYRKSHTYDADYRVTYMEYLVVNGILKSPFTALITFGGTAGYTGLLSHARSVTIVDLSQKMLDAARELHAGKDIELHLIRDDATTFRSESTYDLVELGALGSYIPFDDALLQRYFDMVNPGGILLVKSVIFSRMFSRGALFDALRSNAYDLYRRVRKDTPGITLPGANKRLRSFLGRNKNARVLMKNVMHRFDEPIVNYYIFIRKN